MAAACAAGIRWAGCVRLWVERRQSVPRRKVNIRERSQIGASTRQSASCVDKGRRRESCSGYPSSGSSGASDSRSSNPAGSWTSPRSRPGSASPCATSGDSSTNAASPTSNGATSSASTPTTSSTGSTTPAETPDQDGHLPISRPNRPGVPDGAVPAPVRPDRSAARCTRARPDDRRPGRRSR